MKDNQHVQAIPLTVLTQAQIKIDEAKTLLALYLLALTPVERRELPKIGEKTIGFVEKAYDFVRQSPNLVPPYTFQQTLPALTLGVPTGFGHSSRKSVKMPVNRLIPGGNQTSDDVYKNSGE
jgi:hypothetical protein